VDVDLQAVLDALKTHEIELRRLGVQHPRRVWIACPRRGSSGSDIDILIELDPDRPIGVFGYARLKLDITAGNSSHC
jgi:hypothetical protein